jgi:hypothetical protein
MTASHATGRLMTLGHPLAYSTLRNARNAEWLVATREGRRRSEPVRCNQCDGWHLADEARERAAASAATSP